MSGSSAAGCKGLAHVQQYKMATKRLTMAAQVTQQFSKTRNYEWQGHLRACKANVIQTVGKYPQLFVIKLKTSYLSRGHVPCQTNRVRRVRTKHGSILQTWFELSLAGERISIPVPLSLQSTPSEDLLGIYISTDVST